MITKCNFENLTYYQDIQYISRTHYKSSHTQLRKTHFSNNTLYSLESQSTFYEVFVLSTYLMLMTSLLASTTHTKPNKFVHNP